MGFESKHWILAAVCALGCAGGVADGPDVDAGEPTSSAAPAEAGVGTAVGETVEAASEVEVASTELSPTHKIQFLAYPEPGSVGLREVLHIDEDGMESARLKDEDLAGASLAEVYLRLAETLDAKLFKLVQDVAESPERAVEYLAHAGRKALIVKATQETPSQGESVGTTRQAVCPEPPSWDWFGDDNWFRSNFCQAGVSITCQTLSRVPIATAGVKAGTSSASFYGQSHCSSAVGGGSERFATACDLFGCTRRTFLLPSVMVPSRTVVFDVRSARKGADGKFHEWKRDITSREPSNFVGLEHRAF
jgi:hypothetical protein